MLETGVLVALATFTIVAILWWIFAGAASRATLLTKDQSTADRGERGEAAGAVAQLHERSDNPGKKYSGDRFALKPFF